MEGGPCLPPRQSLENQAIRLLRLVGTGNGYNTGLLRLWIGFLQHGFGDADGVESFSLAEARVLRPLAVFGWSMAPMNGWKCSWIRVIGWYSRIHGW